MNQPKVILTQMTRKEGISWPTAQKHTNKRLHRNTAFFAAVLLCMGGCAWLTVSSPQKAETVMSHLTAGFEYDETLGRLQLVSNILPESAMVFLSTDSSDSGFIMPVQASVSHPWTQQEPWLEYACIGDVYACCDGEIITIVQNRTGTHTMRILHDNGYESVYSGLRTVHKNENNRVFAGQSIGTSNGTASFELRKDGLSVLPSFCE